MVILLSSGGGVAHVPHPALPLHVRNSVVSLLLGEPAAQSEGETEAEEHQGGGEEEEEDQPPGERSCKVQAAWSAS